MHGVYLTSIGSVSAVAASAREAFAGYESGVAGIATHSVGDRRIPLGALSAAGEESLARLARERPELARLDRSTQLAILAARQALSGAEPGLGALAVILGSSRGATESFEHSHAQFSVSGRVAPLTSPTTTLGNLSSNVARELGIAGWVAEISSACATSLQALILGVAWLRAGFGRACLVGGAEAPLTGFTVAQMAALGLVGGELETGAPYQPLARSPKNRLVLGEGACVFLLEALSTEQARERGALAEIIGLGSSLERGPSLTGISPDGEAMGRAMTHALSSQRSAIGAVVVHAPGTKNGDRAELAALERVFEGWVPPLCSSKWQTGHTLGASGAFGIELALSLLSGLTPATPPYDSELSAPATPVESVLVNAAGFGGIATSVLLKRAS